MPAIPTSFAASLAPTAPLGGALPRTEGTTKDVKETTNPAAEKELSPAEKRQLAELRRTDAAVRAHEQAHLNAGRELITSGPNYTYTYGPDNKPYAVAGEVGIDTSPEQEAQANIDKGRRIQKTALAPADPSAQDFNVAASGKRLEAEGRKDLLSEQRSETAGTNRLRAYTSSAVSEAGEPGTVDIYA
jgi:hypothetical protein